MSNSCAFSADLEVVHDRLDRIMTGREFPRAGETKQKDHLAKSDGM